MHVHISVAVRVQSPVEALVYRLLSFISIDTYHVLVNREIENRHESVRERVLSSLIQSDTECNLPISSSLLCEHTMHMQYICPCPNPPIYTVILYTAELDYKMDKFDCGM